MGNAKVYRWECISRDRHGKKVCQAGSHTLSPHRDLVERKARDHEERTGHKTAVYGRVPRKNIRETRMSTTYK